MVAFGGKLIAAHYNYCCVCVRERERLINKAATYQRKADPAHSRTALATSEGPIDLLGVGS